jgi:hypothetical protein
MTAIRYDWATGDRWWGDHVHHKLPDEPINYSGWFEWAKARSKKHKQVRCSTPGCPIKRWSDDAPARG